MTDRSGRERPVRSWWVATTVLLVSLGAVLPLACPRPSRITRENFERIQEGMTEAEVEELLGPPGNYSYYEVRMSSGYYSPEWIITYWAGDEGIIDIGFTDADPPRVFSKEFTPQPSPPTFAERARGLLP